MLKKKKFVKMKPAGRRKFLGALCDSAEKMKANGREEQFWTAVKNLTADGYYTSQAGMRDELGYTGGSVLEAFPNCDAVPEH